MDRQGRVFAAQDTLRAKKAPEQEGNTKGLVTVYVGLGSNSRDAPTMLERARSGLESLPAVHICRASRVYLTEPQDYTSQPWFHNQVLELSLAGEECPQEARNLMAALLMLEAALGRVRSQDPALRFGPRSIDLDILLFGKLVLQDPFCTLPHPRLARRAFWLVPLADLAPDLVIGGPSVLECLDRLDWHAEGNRIYQ